MFLRITSNDVSKSELFGGDTQRAGSRRMGQNIISESRFLEELLLDDEQFTAAIVFTKALATSNRVPLLKFAGFVPMLTRI